MRHFITRDIIMIQHRLWLHKTSICLFSTVCFNAFNKLSILCSYSYKAVECSYKQSFPHQTLLKLIRLCEASTIQVPVSLHSL